MRRILLICSFIIALTFVGTNVQADKFGSFLDNLKKQLDTLGEKQDESATDETNFKERPKVAPKTKVNKKKDSPASNLISDFNGESGSVQDYEGALTAADKVCKRIVDPFRLQDNASALISSTKESSTDGFFKRLSGKKSKAPTLLESAKLRAKKMNWLTMKMEVKHGEMLHKKRLKNPNGLFERSKKGRVKRLYAKGDKLLASVLNQVNEEHPYDFKLFLVNNDELNAEALPGGYLYVNTGVLESKYAELVVAHEIAHVLKRHQTRETQARIIDAVDTYNDLKSLLDKSGSDSTAILQKIVMMRGLVLNYSRQQELQADACSVRLTYSIPGMNVYRKIDPYIASMNTDDKIKPTEKLLIQSGHPHYPERSKRMKLVVREVRNEAASL